MLSSEPSSRPVRGRSLASLLAIILLAAFLVRAYGLGAQSFWHDEGLSVAIAQKGWGQILQGGGEYHPPLYHLLLGAWVRLAGTSEFAARYLSLLSGVALVALGAALGNLLFGRRAGALAALFLAVSPIEVWFAQEARMYALLAALNLAAAICLLRLLRGERHRGLWVAYTLANIAAIYTHYYAALALVAQAAWVLLHLARTRDWRLARSWAWAQLATGVAYLPWLPTLGQQLAAQDTTYWPGMLSWQFVARTVLLGFAGAPQMVTEQAALALARLSGALAALGLLLGLARARSRRGTLLLAAYILVPSVIFYLLVRTRPKCSPRYLLVTVPPLLALAGSGVAALWPRALRRWHDWPRLALAALAALALAASSVYAATNVDRDPAFGRDDMRGVADYLTHTAGDDEAVILLSGHFLPVFSHYYLRANCYPVPPTPTPAPDVNDVVGLESLADLNRAIEGRRGAWLVLWQDEVVDPNDLVLTAFDLAAERQPVEVRFRGIRLRHYRFPEGTQLQHEIFARRPLDVSIAGDVALLGCTLPTQETPGGSRATIVLLWQALRAMQRDYRLSLRLFDEQGQQRAQGGDGPLAGDMYPTSHWQPGVPVVGRHELALPPDLAPGEYDLQVLIYRKGSRDKHWVPLGPIGVGRAQRPATPKELGIAQPLDVHFGELDLLGCDLSPHEATLEETAYLALAWRAAARPSQGYAVAVWLGSLRWASLPLPASLVDMAPGDVFRVVYPLPVPREALPGPQPVLLTLEGRDGRPAAQPVALAELDLSIPGRRFDVPEGIQRPLHINLGDRVTLLGYDLPAGPLHPGEEVHLTLYWQAAQTMDVSYTVFTHLLDGRQRIWGQVDSMPLGGARPTTGWLAGEVLVDSYDIPVQADAPPGWYVVEAGLYDALTGDRRPVFDEAGQRVPGDRILLDPIELQPRRP